MSSTKENPRGYAAQVKRPIGSLLTWKRKGRQYNILKIADTGPRNRRYVPLARFVWEQRFGAIPRGFYVAHKNSDTLDDAPDNLVLVDHRTQLRHQIATLPGMASKRKLRCSKANSERHALKRVIRAGSVVSWDCDGCGNSIVIHNRPKHCGKCGGGSFERARLLIHALGQRRLNFPSRD